MHGEYAVNNCALALQHGILHIDTAQVRIPPLSHQVIHHADEVVCRCTGRNLSLLSRSRRLVSRGKMFSSRRRVG